MSNPWSPLGALAPSDLRSARLALHFAAQPMAAAAYALLEVPEDHTHSNFRCAGEHGRLVGRSLPTGHRAFLDLVAFRTGLLSEDERNVLPVELAGRTLEEVLADMAEALRAADEVVPAEGLTLPAYDLPDAPVAHGERFVAPPREAGEELARWFANATFVLEGVAATHLAAAEVRGWPHHFDLAALHTLDREGDPEAARSLGVGFSPGDGSYEEPYFYVSPWPYPAAPDLPALVAGARWHTEGFTAAVLTGSEVVAQAGPEAQRALCEAALGEAIRVSLELLEA